MNNTSKHLTWLEISQSALLHNVKQFKKLIGQAKLYPVIKSHAYGHGLVEITKVLNKSAEVAGLMVASLDEALDILSVAEKPINILSIWQKDPAKVALAAKKQVVFPVYDLAAAQWLDKLGKKIKHKIKVNIKIDVGTMRLGFRDDDFLDQVKKIYSLSNLDIKGVFSHLADSESEDESFTVEQDKRFTEVINKLEDSGLKVLTKHIACSAAALRNNNYHYQALRLGISLYGVWPSLDIQKIVGDKITLQPVLTWKTRIIQLKDLKQGESVGYGLSYRAPDDTQIAVLPVGYWDGYDRKLSNQAKVIINDSKCSVRGRVCMNLTMVEVPSNVRAQVGDEVVLLGTGGNSTITVEELARIIGTINYEVTTRINPLLPRILVK